jgi:phage FluMu protein Com
MPPTATPILPERRCTCCNALLFTGMIKDGALSIKCKCGTMNTLIVGKDASYQSMLNLLHRHRA